MLGEFGKTKLPVSLEELANKTEDDKTALFINNLASQISSENAKKGFWDYTNKDVQELIDNCNDLALKVKFEKLQRKVSKVNIHEKLILIVSEIGEAVEGHRKDKMDEHLPHRKSFEVEIADAMIRIFDMCGGLGIDLGGAMMEKLNYNRTRPHVHGKKY